jgi:hypothetical protein
VWIVLIILGAILFCWGHKSGYDYGVRDTEGTLVKCCEASRTSIRGGRMRVLLDPKFFNYLILALYVTNSVRWAYAGRIADVCYWLSAAAITATVTFLYNH